MDKRFKKLFEPIKIGSITVRNRIFMPSMFTSYAGINGESTDQDIGYFKARARGGAGLITIDYTCVSPEGRGMWTQRGLWADMFMPHFSRVVDAIKSCGAVASVQLHHAGIAAIQQPKGPSRLSYQEFFVTSPGEFSSEEVEELVVKFADAAMRAKKCGVDMVEVHGAHGYLICQFMSPLLNMRTDKYGRDRPLFAIEIVQKIKEKCGTNFPVSFRISADEYCPGGITLDYAKEIAQRLEAAGVDLINVSGTNPDTEDYCEPNMYLEDEEEGEYYRFIKLGSEIKRVVNIPVVSGGLVSDPLVAERLLEEGALDMIWVGRQLIADPDWPNKVRIGRLEDIRPCCACNDGCIGRVFINKTVWCTVNPMTGFEYKWTNEEALPKPAESKKVLIVGSGPGGLEAARICAIRGHEVSIIENDDQIGGTINIAGIPSFKKRWRKLVEWYGTQLTKFGVEIQLNTKATASLIEKEAPDVLVLATGSEPVIPDIRGIEKAVMGDDVLLGKRKVGENVVIIGGGLEGLDIALYLAKQGKKVTVVEALPQVGDDLEVSTQMSFFRKHGGLIDKFEISIMTESPVIKVKDNGVEVVDNLGHQKLIEGDTVICAAGRKSVLDSELIEDIERVYVIGDARSPRKIIDAIHEGFTVALDI